ncbi:2-amino-4-hydroxy-6-hydroxymethyldihydropteridine diphosphokinase [Algoriphagus sp.]|uniref:2-amino-4-hydroxy-6- hydroxymethyldihydropteridine diphosphokinase n=1 Tax=Algoriphagus sp. TaxID=1872435 RepID=UPI0025E12DE9|nr:2-amino-4-hydroxy-6-hydroxymethyldihydropteridine diphosphokinase [Algoriphagus sp.]
MESKVTLILGGNRGNREVLLKTAVNRLTSNNKLLLESSIYETEAWGGIAKEPFLNQVIQVRSSQDPLTLLAFIQKVEIELGRKRNEHWGDRTMDIDILFWDDLVLDTPDLKIPHPWISQRKFVLIPLNEILPDFTHPTKNKTIKELLKNCEDNSIVYRFKK